MILRRLVLTLLLVQMAVSQDGGPGSIHGVVINEFSGQPYAEASVELLGIQRGRVLTRTVRTDAKGQFHFADVPPGSGYQIIVTGERLQPTAHGQRSWNEPWIPIRLEPGENRRDLEIPVQPFAAIRGRVVDSQGKGLFGARVVVLKAVYEPRRTLLESSTAVTNSRGDYQFLRIPAGVYYLRVSPQNSESATNVLLSAPSRVDRAPASTRSLVVKDPEGYPVTYFPSTIELESAKPVNLKAGGTADNTDIIVTKIRTGRARGMVTHNGKPVSVGQVLLQRDGTASDSNWTRVAEVEEGQFDLRGVIPGSYRVWARVGESDQRLWARTVTEIRAGEVSTVPVKLGSAPDISGRISVEGWTEATQPDLTKLSVFLLPDGLAPVDTTLDRLELNMPTRTASVAADGQFTFRGVGPWDYRVIVAPANPAVSLGRVYLKASRMGNSDVASEGLHVTPELQGSLDLTLALDSGGLDGRVTDAERGTEASRIVIVPDARNRSDRYLAVKASGSGRFQIQGIPPGKYKIFTWREVPSGAWFDPEFLRNYEDRAMAVEIQPGVSDFVELKWSP